MSFVTNTFGKFYKYDSILVKELIQLQGFKELILKRISTEQSHQIEQTA